MELQGTIKSIGGIQTFGSGFQTFGSGFQKIEFVLLTTEQYPQPVSIEIIGDKIDILDPYKVGDNVMVGINIRGREWVSPQGKTKYFNSIVAWKLQNSTT